MSMILIILLGIPLLSVLWWVWADRRLNQLGRAKYWRWGIAVASALLLATFVWVILSRRDVISLPIPSALYATLLLWALIFLPFIAVPTMLAWGTVSLVRKLAGANESQHPAGRKWTRREWLKASVVGMPMVATILTSLVSLPQMKRFRVRELTVTLPDLPEALNGLRIVHLTDTHVGKFTKGQVIDEIVAATNELAADLILFTGDLIDNTLRDLPEAVRMLQKLQATSGLFAVEGNHDLFDDPKAFVDGVREGGITLLRNETALVQIRGVAVQVLGIVWNRSEAKMALDVDAVASMRDPDAFPLLLAHHPHAFDRAAELGIPLTLAGHTHGGQLMLTDEIGAGPAIFRYWSGIYQKGRNALVVGNGTGNWFPLRTHAPAEIIHLTLRKA